MKILQVNSVYAEKSTGKLTEVLHNGIKAAGHISLVAYGRGAGAEGEGIFRICSDSYAKAQNLFSRFTGVPYGGCLLSTGRLIGFIEREKPDVVHLQCINGYFVNIFRLVSWLRDRKIKTVLSLHAEFMYTGSCAHAFECEQWKHGCQKCPSLKKATKSLLLDRTAASWRAMKAAFEGFEDDCIICPVSPWTESRARQSDIFKNFRFRTVLDGIDTDVFNRRGASDAEADTDERVVLHVTAAFSADKSHPKGGAYLIELAKRMPQLTFKVAGTVIDDGEKLGSLPKNLILLGAVRDQRKLAQLYREAAVSVVVSRKETFSLPCAESLCCGTPVVGFKAGAPEQISLPEYSEFVEFGDADALEAAVKRRIDDSGAIPRDAVAAEAERKYSAQTMVESFLEIYGRDLWN